MDSHKNDRKDLTFSHEYIGLNNCKMHSLLSDEYKNYTPISEGQKKKPQKSKFAIFCEASSVRGMQKIHKSQSKFLKFLWISFVLFMSILLIIISTNLVIDFRNYHTAWHISTELDEKTRFPAISICSHNPFSKDASKLWKEGQVLTPEEFRKRLYEMEMKIARTGKIISLPLLDTADEYYGNIDYSSSKMLGHKRQILKYCVVRNEGFTIIAENCLVENETGFTVTEFSNNNFFNCFTIETKSEKNGFDQGSGDLSNETMSLILLINVNLFSDLYQANESFVMDTLTRGEGLRLVIHQVGSYPDIDKSGINIQPGKMNEITFQNVHWTRYSSPKRQCKDNQPPIRDLNRLYDYTFPQCLDAIINKELIEKCKCMSTIWPRPQIPTKLIPYCNDFSGNASEITKRFDCAFDNVYSKIKSIKASAVGTKCWPLCTFNTYETTLSITRWTPSLYKLKKITKSYRIVNNIIDQINLTNDTTIKQKLTENYIEDLKQDLSSTLSKHQQKSEEPYNEHQMNYVNLVRKNFDTTIRTEKLFIDVYIFISRVGGLCSLCIGLTTAFFIEIIEFLYLCYYTERSQIKTERSEIEKNKFNNISDDNQPSLKDKCCETYFNKNKLCWHNVEPICQCPPIHSSSQIYDSI